MGQVFNDNIQLAALDNFRKITLFGNIPLVSDDLTMSVCHNVRAYCRKEAVEFIPFKDQHGVEMILVKVLGELKGYAEPAN
jgi:hypothetical protein